MPRNGNETTLKRELDVRARKQEIVRRGNAMSYQRRLINYTVACVNEFAEAFNLNVKEAYRYLRDFKGIEFLNKDKDTE